MDMAIQKDDYEKFKEYWDFQRKVEYNKEQVFKMADRFEGRIFSDFGQVNIDDMKQTLWARVPQEEYEDPPLDWVPENENYRFWHETGGRIQNKLSSKARKVVLRANPSLTNTSK